MSTEYPQTTLSARVLKVFTDNPGIVVYRDDIVNETGLSPEKVRTTVANIRNTGKNGSPHHPGNFIEIVSQGHAWLYHPNAQPATQFSDAVAMPKAEARQHYKVTPVAASAQSVEEKPKAVARPVGVLFEAVGKSEDGTVIVKDERGRLFRVVTL